MIMNTPVKRPVLIISGFPGIGKTCCTSALNTIGLRCLDSDSSRFSWVEKDGVKERDPAFPANYLGHIRSEMGRQDFILVSSHATVREALAGAKIPYTLVFPEMGLKDEYVQRYINRGSPDTFVNMLESKWEAFINECLNDPTPSKIVLKSNEYILSRLVPV